MLIFFFFSIELCFVISSESYPIFNLNIGTLKLFLDGFFKHPSFKIALSEQVSGGQASSQVYLLFNFCQSDTVTFIRQSIAFILVG